MFSLLTDLEKRYFKELTELDGVTTEENRINKYILEETRDLNLEVLKDNVGNLVLLKKGSNSDFKVLLDSHTDEVGFLVKEILDNGLIKVTPIGGINPNILPSLRIKLRLRNKLDFKELKRVEEGKEFKGCFSSSSNDVSFDTIFADFGFASKENAEVLGVRINDVISFDEPCVFLNNDRRILSKAIDNRYGVILSLIVLKELKDVTLPYDFYVSFSKEEETGLVGIQSTLKQYNFDFAIALDCSRCGDNNVPKNDGKLGDGVLIRYIDRGFTSLPTLLDYQIHAIKETSGKYQYFKSLGTTDASKISQANILTLTHCICARDIHTSSSIIDTFDYIYSKNSLIYILKDINKDKFNFLTNERYY